MATTSASKTREETFSSETPRRTRVSTHSRTGYAFIAPFMVVFVLTLIVPLLYALYISLFRRQLIGGTTFVGLENYVTALTDERLLDGVWRVIRFFLIQVPIMLAISIFAALALDSGVLRVSRLFRLGIFLPYAVPAVVAALMWAYLYGPNFGPFAQLADGLGLPDPPFLSEDWMLGSIANIVTWEFAGYNMLILYAALRAIPTELYEAAAVDGAGQWRIAWSIKLPAIRGALVLTLIFSVIGSFQLFAEPNLMQRLAPSVIDNAWTPNLYAYNLSFTGQQINYAAAVSFMLGAVIVIASYVVLFFINRRSRS
jgi:multiple sugar transport system permease protein